MLHLIGGLQAIKDLPTNFGCVVVLCMFSSIFIPMFISNLHLTVNSFEFFLTKSYGKPTVLMLCLLFLLSPLQPVFLEIKFLELADEARRLAQNYNIETIQKKLHGRKIKKQLVNFIRIELGEVNTCR